MEAGDLAGMEKALRELIAWRDFLAGEILTFDGEIAQASRAYANALGLTVKPSLAQLRQMLGLVDKRAAGPLPIESGLCREGPACQPESE